MCPRCLFFATGIRLCFFCATENQVNIFLEINLDNTGFQPEKRTFSNPFTLKINFFHLENKFLSP